MTAVQQHSVFIEIVVEKVQKEEQIHEFAAVVGLIKTCKEVRNQFDNAVLWFNDQFLFGEKQSEKRNATGGIGFQPNASVNRSDLADGDQQVEREGFVGGNERGTPRWGGCFTPNGFAHAIGADDPAGIISTPAGNFSSKDLRTADTDCGSLFSGCQDIDDNMDAVKELIDLDNTCQGCIFEYQSSLFVIDPNGHNWIVDKYVYPLSVMGNLFTSGGGPNCGDDDSAVQPFLSDERSSHHADRCEDDGPGDNDAENHCYDDGGETQCSGGEPPGGHPESDGLPVTEPLFSVHLQTNPTTGLGWADKAAFEFDDQGGTSADTDDGSHDVQDQSAGGVDGNDPDNAADTTTDTTEEADVRRGAIYPEKGTPNREFCEDHESSPECSLEYNFLIAVDFAAFDDSAPIATPGDEINYTGENEIDREGCPSGQHGPGESTPPEWWQGNSHPHTPDGEEPDAVTQGKNTPQHCHPTVNLDIFFYSQAPYFTEQNEYWNENGIPPLWTDDCEQSVNDPQDQQDDSVLGSNGDPVEVRTPLVCDADEDAGEFHAHDGTESPPKNVD